MSKKASATTIGLFITVGTALAAALAIYFGSISLFGKTKDFIFFFDESVHGLETGANVKLRGVPIGTVTDILLHAENQPASDDHIPVIAAIDMEQVRSLGITTEEYDLSDAAQIRQLIQNKGLRAQLQLESLITGVQYIELDFHNPEEMARYSRVLPVESDAYIEIPTKPSPLAAIGESATDVFAKFTELDLNKRLEDISTLTQKASKAIDDLQLEKLSNEAQATMTVLRKRADALQVEALVEEATLTLKTIRETMATIEGKADTVVVDTRETNERLQEALTSFTRATAALEEAAQPDSPVSTDLRVAMAEISEAARAVRLLAEYLERNPNALITGKPR